MDSRWRNHLESLRRAGLDYVLRDRLVPSEALNATNVAVEESAGTSNQKPGLSLTEKKSQLEILATTVAGCTRCEELARTRTQTVFSDGSPDAEICFVGEAPGGDEDAQGVPFVGKAGQLLTRMIEGGFKIKRSEVYICNVLKCRPPGNRNPDWSEMHNCKEYLEAQLRIVRPKVLIALGKYAAAFLLGEKPEQVPITKIRGQWREYLGIPVMITLHPAYLLRNSDAKREVWEDMKEVLRFLGRPVPE